MMHGQTKIKVNDIYRNRKYAVLATGLYAHANPSSQTQLSPNSAVVFILYM